MLGYYLFTIFVSFINTVNSKLAGAIVFIGVPFIISGLPSTDSDYDAYKASYDSAVTSNDFPYFIEYSYLDAEPFYLFYTSFISVVTGFPFSIFLAFNFLVCILLSSLVFKYINWEYFHTYWLFLLPVVIPTIFYFSPRSSLSYIFILIGFIYLIKDNWKIALILFGFGISTHSQFLLIVFLIFISYWIIKRLSKTSHKLVYKYILFSSGFLIIFLLFVDVFMNAILSVISFLPSAELATGKVSYLVNERSGFRATSLLSIVLYPFMAYKFSCYTREADYEPILFKNIQIEVFFAYLLLAATMYGLAVNVAYFDNPHVAGRLSRFSDYTGMGLLIPIYFNSFVKKGSLKAVFIIFVLVAPFLFPTLYHKTNWGF